jgi:hypothetical protein
MKKTINILLVMLITFLLSSCVTSQTDVNQAKHELWIIELEEDTIDSWTNIDMEIEKAKDEIIQVDEMWEEKKEEIKKFEIISLTDDQFLEFDDLTNENFLDSEVEIKWKTLAIVDKIIVTFVNETSDFPVDTYTLKQFSSWDESFLYRAFSRYETLDYGKNVYVFEAHSWVNVTKLQIILNVIKEEEKEISEKVEEIFEDVSLDTLPVSSTFWNPTYLWSGKVSYSDLKWLEIKRDVNSDLTCDNLTSILADKLNGWFFWNTCRPIEADEGISFFVIRLDGEDYIYEKHYYLSYEWIYWVQELETWTWVTADNIWEKNSELKEWNKDFSILNVSDDLFIQILK